MAIGDGFSDPINMLNYGEYLINVGLIDEKQKRHFDEEEEKTRHFIRTKQYKKAFEVRGCNNSFDLLPKHEMDLYLFVCN